MPLPAPQEPPHPSSAYSDDSGRPSPDLFDYLKGVQQWGRSAATAVATIETSVTSLGVQVTTINDEITAINALIAGLSATTLLLDTRNDITTATVAAAVTHILVSGFAAVGDGGESIYKRVTPTPSPVRKYHAQSVDGAYWIYAPPGKLNPKAIGAKGDNSQDEAPYFDDIIVLASGRKIYAPGGASGYRFDRPLSSYAGPINIEGDGNGQSTSPGVTDYTRATTFRLNFASGYLFSVDTSTPMVFRDILFYAVVTPMVGGGALYFTCSTGGLGCSPCVYGCAFTLVYNGIYCHKVSNTEIAQRNVFNQPVNAAIYLDTDSLFEGGGGTIFGNIIIGYIGPTTYGIYSECGYAKINCNYIVGCVNGVELHVSPGAGAYEIVQNQLEEQTGYGVLLARLGTGVAAMPQIKDNEFSNLTQTGITAHIGINDDAGNDWVDSTSITGNIMRSNMANGGCYIKVNSGTGITCDMNEIHHLGGGSPTAIQISGSAVKNPVYCRNNRLGGGGTLGTRYDTSAAVIIHDTSITYANLPAACANGSMFFVTDGKATNIGAGNYTLTNGGGGALSVRIGGVHTVGGVA